MQLFKFERGGVSEGAFPDGIYLIKWVEGGSSLAAVGTKEDGTRWYAPTNWINLPPQSDWTMVESITYFFSHVPVTFTE